jgi:hypothetical protein
MCERLHSLNNMFLYYIACIYRTDSGTVKLHVCCVDGIYNHLVLFIIHKYIYISTYIYTHVHQSRSEALSVNISEHRYGFHGERLLALHTTTKL